jgi:hypothetical protein
VRTWVRATYFQQLTFSRSSRITSSLVALAMVLVLGLVIFNGVRTWRLWRGLRRLDDTARLSCTLLFRLGIFTVFSVSAIGYACLTAGQNNRSDKHKKSVCCLRSTHLSNCAERFPRTYAILCFHDLWHTNREFPPFTTHFTSWSQRFW